MAIHSIRVQNFKSIRDTGELRLKPLNILIGANGSGKSNFINFFKFVNRIYERRQKVYVNQHGKADNFLYFGRKKSDFLNGKIIFDNEFNSEYEFQMVATNKNDLIFEFENNNYWQREFDFDKGQFVNNIKRQRIASGRDESIMSYFEDFDKDHFYLKNIILLREALTQFKVFHFHDTSFNAKVKQPCALNDNAYLHEDGGNLAAFLYVLQEKHPQIFRKIEAILRFVTPFFDRFYLKPDELDAKFIELRWLEKNSEQLFDAHNLSDGTLRMICLLTLLLQPNLPQTIIIDEPELGLHPNAIIHLAGLFRSASKRCQVIVATQSPDLVSQFEAEDIITVDRAERTKETVFKRWTSDELKVWLDDYSLGELWEKNIIGGKP